MYTLPAFSDNHFHGHSVLPIPLLPTLPNLNTKLFSSKNSRYNVKGKSFANSPSQELKVTELVLGTYRVI